MKKNQLQVFITDLIKVVPIDRKTKLKYKEQILKNIFKNDKVVIQDLSFLDEILNRQRITTWTMNSYYFKLKWPFYFNESYNYNKKELTILKNIFRMFESYQEVNRELMRQEAMSQGKGISELFNNHKYF